MDWVVYEKDGQATAHNATLQHIYVCTVPKFYSIFAEMIFRISSWRGCSNPNESRRISSGAGTRNRLKPIRRHAIRSGGIGVSDLEFIPGLADLGRDRAE
jgi:hypothetical protein